MKREEKIATESKGQRAKESVQCSKFKVHSSQSLLPLTTRLPDGQEVNGSENTSLNPGIQPHSIWLKPVAENIKYLYDMRLAVRNRIALNKRISTVFHIKPSANGTFFPAEGCISESRAVRACLMIRVFNN